MNFVLLETDRLILKGMSPELMNEIFETQEKSRIMEILGHQNEEEYERELSKYQRGYSSYRSRFLLFLIVRKDNQKIIGRCGLHNWNPDHNRAEIGYNLLMEVDKRQGFMSEAVKKILEYGFRTLDLHRIEAMLSPTNIPSKRIIEKFGFTKEGQLREHFQVDGAFGDSLIYSLLQSEYERS